MEHVSVSSSQIASVAYDQDALRMQVLFRRGGLYEYDDVTASEYESVLHPTDAHSSSVGVAFGQVIKGRKTFRKLEGSAWPSGNAPAAAAPQSAPAAAVEQTTTKAELPAEAQIVSRKSNELTAQANAIEVIDPASQERASEVLLTIAAMRKEIADTFKPMKDAAFKTHRTICEQEKAVDAPLAEAERNVKSRIGSFVQEQQRLARIEEDRLREEARQVAAEEARQRAQELALEQAIDLEARGNVEAAEAVLANPAPVAQRYVAPAPVAPAVAQVKGVTMRTDWDFRIVDISLIPREYMVVNETAIRAMGKSTKGRARIPGVEFYEKAVVATSRRG